MKNDEELELLLGEIPHGISSNPGNIHHHRHHSRHGHGDHHHGNGSFRTQKNNVMMYGRGMYDDDDTLTHNYSDKHTCASPVSGFSLQSDGSSSSLFSTGNPSSENGWTNTPSIEDLKPLLFSGNFKDRNGLPTEFNSSDNPVGRNVSNNVVDEINLERYLKNLRIAEQPVEGLYKSKPGLFSDCNISSTVQLDPYFVDYRGYQLGMPAASVDLDSEMRSGMARQQNLYCQSNVLGSPYMYSIGPVDDVTSYLNSGGTNMYCQLPTTKGSSGHHYYRGIPVSNLFGPMAKSPASGLPYCPQLNEINTLAETDAFGIIPNVPQITPNIYNYHQPTWNNYSGLPLHVGMHYGSSLEDPTRADDSLIFQGESVNRAMNRGYRRSFKGQNTKNNQFEAKMSGHKENRGHRDGCFQNQDSVRSLKMCSPLSAPLRGTLSTEAQGYIYHIAKDQQGCRFLQRVFDEGSTQDFQIVFNGIIDHVIELMMNPFGNYLMQKMLEVCNEEQRTQILLKVTAKPGELIRISLNTHGTRVVQKLIETLKSRQHISLVISALEPGFIALIKDLNGNHVVQRCLQCLTNEDSKFIFIAAAKYCVDIATHPHGCCVLQKCIRHSTGQLRDNLIAEISSNGLLLAQDAFGNYVVQFILELEIPSATAKLVSQFDGNYVHLSAQNFGSHVVEKCLLVCSKEIQSKIVHELLSCSQFEQVLQDPHANYVVQTALKVSEGPLRQSLVDKIEAHKATSRNSPYSKRLFSHKLLKK